MGPQTSKEAYRNIQRDKRSAWEKIYLFDSRYTEKTDSLFATEEDSFRDDFFDDWTPGSNRPLFHCFDRQLFRKDNRLFLAIEEWRKYPLWLRENVDQWAERFPEWVDNYGDRHGGLERMYHWAHELAGQHLIDVAEEHGIKGAEDIYIAGVLCRELLKDRASRQKLWGQKYVIGDWPDCLPHLMQLAPDVREGILRGNGVVARLWSLLTLWRHQTGEPVPPVPEWDRETRTLKFTGIVVRKVAARAKWILILDSFHEDKWATWIYDPLACDADLSECLRQLNKGLKLIKFLRDGEKIRWIDCRPPN